MKNSRDIFRLNVPYKVQVYTSTQLTVMLLQSFKSTITCYRNIVKCYRQCSITEVEVEVDDL